MKIHNNFNLFIFFFFFFLFHIINENSRHPYRMYLNMRLKKDHLSLCSNLVNREGEMISFKIDIRSPFIFNSMEKKEKTCSQSITQFVPISSFRHLVLVIFANECFEQRLIILSGGKYQNRFSKQVLKFKWQIYARCYLRNIHLLRIKDVRKCVAFM